MSYSKDNIALTIVVDRPSSHHRRQLSSAGASVDVVRRIRCHHCRPPSATSRCPPLPLTVRRCQPHLPLSSAAVRRRSLSAASICRRPPPSSPTTVCRRPLSRCRRPPPPPLASAAANHHRRLPPRRRHLLPATPCLPPLATIARRRVAVVRRCHHCLRFML